MRVLALALVLARSALRGLRASLATTAIAISTIAIALGLVGGFALLVGNMSDLLEGFGEDLQVVAYVDEDVSGAGLRRLAATVGTVEGVEAVAIVSKEAALDRFRETAGSALLEGLEGNPLPASLEVALRPASRTPEGIAIVVEALSGLPGISDLAHGQDWVEGYARFAALVRAAAYGLGLILSAAALLIVANTIRLAVHAREDEIEILALVGASRSFIRTPFLIEGALQGALGGALALGALYLAFRTWLPELEYGLELLIGNARPRFLATGQAVWVVLAGALLGLLGSLAAVLGSGASR